MTRQQIEEMESKVPGVEAVNITRKQSDTAEQDQEEDVSQKSGEPVNSDDMASNDATVKKDNENINVSKVKYPNSNQLTIEQEKVAAASTVPVDQSYNLQHAKATSVMASDDYDLNSRSNLDTILPPSYEHPSLLDHYKLT